jgi:ATP:ADP antiporter, AAA family
MHRTGLEILYVPLSQSVRERFKSFVEAVGQRGGQGLASVVLLLATRGGLRPSEIGLGLFALAGLWLAGATGIRPHYIDLFRKTLREGALETHLEAPDLDLHSLEALIAALSSHNDAEVRASLDMLESYGKTNLVPALIFYHPSAEIVLRAFELLSSGNRPDVERLVPRLMAHEDERIRAAALRYSAANADLVLLESMSRDPSPLVRSTANVEFIRRGRVDEWKGGDVLRGIIDDGSAEERHALAFAARALPPGRYSWALVRLAFVREPGLAVEVARSMAAAPDVDFVPTLVRLLAVRECREDARAAILALGAAALSALDTALADAGLPRTVRRHLPRTVSRFGTAEAAAILERRIPREADELVQLKLLRSLGRMRGADRGLSVDKPMLLEHARSTLERAITLLFYRVVTERVSHEELGPKSVVAEMLSALLAEKEAGALDRVFRILTILDPSEQFGILLTGLRSEDTRLRDSGRELLSHVVSEPLRSGILAMLGDGTAETRLRDAVRFHDPEGRSRLERASARLSGPTASTKDDALKVLANVHVDCLRSMLLDSSDALRSVSSYRIAELGLGELETELRSAAAPEGRALAELSDRAVDLFDRRGAEVSRAG